MPPPEIDGPDPPEVPLLPFENPELVDRLLVLAGRLGVVVRAATTQVVSPPRTILRNRSTVAAFPKPLSSTPRVRKYSAAARREPPPQTPSIVER